MCASAETRAADADAFITFFIFGVLFFFLILAASPPPPAAAILTTIIRRREGEGEGEEDASLI